MKKKEKKKKKKKNIPSCHMSVPIKQLLTNMFFPGPLLKFKPAKVTS